MTGDLEAAAEAYRRAVARVENGLAEVAEARAAVPEARQALAAQIVRAYGEGVRVGELAKLTGYGREQVRRILRAAGVEPVARD